MAKVVGDGGSSRRRQADMKADREKNKMLNDVHRRLGSKPPYDEKVGNPQGMQRGRALNSQAQREAENRVNARNNATQGYVNRGQANGTSERSARAAADRRDSAAVARQLRQNQKPR